MSSLTLRETFASLQFSTLLCYSDLYGFTPEEMRTLIDSTQVFLNRTVDDEEAKAIFAEAVRIRMEFLLLQKVLKGDAAILPGKECGNGTQLATFGPAKSRKGQVKRYELLRATA